MRARFIFVFVLSALAATGGLIAALWHAPTPRTILVLNNASVTEPAFEGLRDGLAELGWREGRDIQYLHPGPQSSSAQLLAHARDPACRARRITHRPLVRLPTQQRPTSPEAERK